MDITITIPAEELAVIATTNPHIYNALCPTERLMVQDIEATSVHPRRALSASANNTLLAAVKRMIRA